MTDTTVATTIWQQLGGNRFDRMVGVKKKAALGADTLVVLLPKNFCRNKATRLSITLTPMDTYTVVFSRLEKFTEFVEISRHEDVYAEDLVDLFERETGLATRLAGFKKQKGN